MDEEKASVLGRHIVFLDMRYGGKILDIQLKSKTSGKSDHMCLAAHVILTT